MYKVIEFCDEDGTNHFKKWLMTLDTQASARIQARIFRFQMGNLGDVKSVGSGIYEARFHFGPGYRVFFGQDGGRIIILLLGGDKSTQRNDIIRAKILWSQYKEM